MKLWLWGIILLGLFCTIGVLAQSSFLPSVQHDLDNQITESTDSQMEIISERAKFQSSLDPALPVNFVRLDIGITCPSSLYTPHAPIEISTDAEFAAIAASGSGTVTDPYRLEGWNITTTGTHGIYIHDTTQHFVVQNCWVETGKSNEYAGIYIQNVAEGTATIAHNICTESIPGISLEYVRNATVLNNTCFRNLFTGISLLGCKTTTIVNNTCYSNPTGISNWWSGFSVIVNNTCHDSNNGIDIGASENSTIINNVCYNAGVGLNLLRSESSTIMSNTCYNNDIGIELESSDVLMISNNTCYNNDIGITVRRSENSIVSHNACQHNRGIGIMLGEIANSTITHNSCASNNMTGIVLNSVTTCNVTHNLLLENQGHGLSLNSATLSNQLHHNSFLNNNHGTLQATDSGFLNQWSENATKEGNYWSDHAGIGSYPLAGTTNVTDPYPLVDILDFDEDGMPDGWEYQIGLNPANSHDAHYDADDDGMPNLWEYQMGLNATLDDAANDHEGDGMPNLWEYQMGLNATLDDAVNDQDRDGMPNLWEYRMGLNATNANDATFDLDKDGLTNLQEYRAGTDPYDSDSDDDFFSDGLDYGWWGNPRANWDNPLTRGLFLILLLGLGIWIGFVAVQLPKLQEEMKQQIQHLQNQAEQLQQKIIMFSSLESLQELEETAEEINQLVFTCEQTIQSIRNHVARKWLPFFLRPDLTPLDTINTSVIKSYKEFQQTHISRIKEFMVDEGSFTVSSAENSTEQG
ncbi:MAG: nitrous oxide reductase family maturation protein NosD [Promethearchaeota archaeon]